MELKVGGKEIRFVEGLAAWKTGEAFMLLPLTSILLHLSKKKNCWELDVTKDFSTSMVGQTFNPSTQETGSQISSKATYST